MPRIRLILERGFCAALMRSLMRERWYRRPAKIATAVHGVPAGAMASTFWATGRALACRLAVPCPIEALQAVPSVCWSTARR
jgi:hypothetical protein